MLTIRQARSSDSDAICAVQSAAIVRHYARTLGDDFARGRAERVDTAVFRSKIEAAMVIVAEEAGALLGFAQFDGTTGEIELSCNPDAEQRAIPAALLAVIETEARARGLDLLHARAMIGTASLYVASGFAPASATATQSQPSGEAPLPILKLEKRLVYAEPRPERRRNGAAHRG